MFEDRLIARGSDIQLGVTNPAFFRRMLMVVPGRFVTEGRARCDSTPGIFAMLSVAMGLGLMSTFAP